MTILRGNNDMSSATQQRFPAREHASKVIAELLKSSPKNAEQKQAILLQGSPVLTRDDTDRELPFHQEANFNYLTGCLVPDASLLITFSSPSDLRHHLFIPPADPLVTMWSVAPPTLDEAKAKFDSDEIEYTTQLKDRLSSFEGTVHTLPTTTEFPSLPLSLSELKGQHVTDLLRDALHIARMVKTEYEIELIREANRISSGAHEVLMRELGRYAKQRGQQSSANGSSGGGGDKERTGTEGITEWEVESEGDAEALFVASCRRMGANPAYLPICASGSRASTLHYVCNDRLFPSTSLPRAPGDTSFRPTPIGRGCCGALPNGDHHQDEDTASLSLHDSAFKPQVLLIDAGCEWMGYASDITRTIPIGNGGKYTEKAGHIYELVLRMQKETEEMVKPGVHWDVLHLHAHKVLVDGFLKLGIFEGDAESILQTGVTLAFFPHGLGHSLGLDVHDSLQYLRTNKTEIPESSMVAPEKLFRYLRIRQTLKENMVLTVEPGCYFPPQLMGEHGAWTSEFVNKDKLREYCEVGGVRIEDVVVVRGNKCENLTTAVREREEIEKNCSGA